MDAVYTEDFEDNTNEGESKFVVIENESDVDDGEAKEMPELNTDEVPPALAQYLAEIHSIPLLTVEEEVHYGRLALRGDKQAQDILVVHNLRLAATYALKIRNPDVPPEDMIQYANLGLMNAARHYNPDTGFRFSTYATWWIRQSIGRQVAVNEGVIRVPVHLQVVARRVRRYRYDFKKSHGRFPADEEVARNLGISITRIKTINALPPHPTSLDKLLTSESADFDDLTFAEIMPSDEDTALSAEENYERSQLWTAMHECLNKKEFYTLTKRFGLFGVQTETLKEIAGEIGVTRERVRQIQKLALEKLVKHAKVEGNRDEIVKRLIRERGRE